MTTSHHRKGRKIRHEQKKADNRRRGRTNQALERRGGGAYVSCVSATKESNVPVRAKPVGDNGPLMSKNLEKKHNKNSLPPQGANAHVT